MIIADLNHFEIVAQETKVIGGGKNFFVFPFAQATATADATAVGLYTVTNSYAIAEAVPGIFSRSQSGAFSQAVG